MEFLIFLIGSEAIVTFIFFAAIFILGLHIAPQVIYILLILFIVVTFITCIFSIIAGDSKTKFAGCLGLFVFIFAGVKYIKSDFFAESCPDLFIEKEQKILAQSDTFISFSNFCPEEELIAVDIMYISDKNKKTDGSKWEQFLPFFWRRLFHRVNDPKWEQLWPSKGKVFEISKLPIKSGRKFTLRIKTRDKEKSVIMQEPPFICLPDYLCHIVYFAKEEIDPLNEKNISVSYNGKNILINSDFVHISDAPFFKANTIVDFRYNFYSISNIISSKPGADGLEYYVSSPASHYHELSRSQRRGNCYNNLLLSKTDGLPLNIGMLNLPTAEPFYIQKKEYMSLEKNLIEFNSDEILVNKHQPNFCKFDYTEKPLHR